MHTRSQSRRPLPSTPSSPAPPSPPASSVDLTSPLHTPSHRRISIVNLITPLRDATNRLAGPSDSPLFASKKQANAPLTPRNVELSANQDLTVVAAVTTVDPLRDFPHMRFQCAVHPWRKGRGSPKYSYCDQCYCYVCDILARECDKWLEHAAAVHKVRRWEEDRYLARLWNGKFDDL